MQRLEVSGAVRPIYGSLGVKRLNPRGGMKLTIHIRPVPILTMIYISLLLYTLTSLKRTSPVQYDFSLEAVRPEAIS